MLDWSPSCIHLFSRGGDFLTSCISQGGGSRSLVSCPFFFCMDIEENIIISDYNRHVIKIFSKPGQLIHTIGMRGEGRVQFIRPYGISISQFGTGASEGGGHRGAHAPLKNLGAPLTVPPSSVHPLACAPFPCPNR